MTASKSSSASAGTARVSNAGYEGITSAFCIPRSPRVANRFADPDGVDGILMRKLTQTQENPGRVQELRLLTYLSLETTNSGTQSRARLISESGKPDKASLARAENSEALDIATSTEPYR